MLTQKKVNLRRFEDNFQKPSFCRDYSDELTKQTKNTKKKKLKQFITNN